MIFRNMKNSIQNILPLILFFIGLTSCTTMNKVKTIEVEVMKPADFIIPEQVKNIAIFNRNSRNHSGTLYNFGGSNFRSDTTLNRIELSNYCVNGLADFFENEAYFQKVNNYRDTLNNSQKDPTLMFKDILHEIATA